MKIALINENSQAAKNSIVEASLRKVVEPKGYEVVNYGMYSAQDDAQLTYVQNGILAAILLNSGAADFVVTGCGTGEGAMLALNSFPGVICGHDITTESALGKLFHLMGEHADNEQVKSLLEKNLKGEISK